MSTAQPGRAPAAHADAHGIEYAVEELRKGRMIIVTDDADREGEGDLMVRGGSRRRKRRQPPGTGGPRPDLLRHRQVDAERLDLKVQGDEKRKPLHGTAFTESVDWIRGTTTGVSASDRAAALRGLADARSRPDDLALPGHIFPDRCSTGGGPRARGTYGGGSGSLPTCRDPSRVRNLRDHERGRDNGAGPGAGRQLRGGLDCRSSAWRTSSGFDAFTSPW